jgi:hypothetical protein
MKQPARHSRQSPRPLELAAVDSPNDEIARARSMLDALIAFLEEARRSLDALPASQNGRSVATSGHMLETLLEHARRTPAVTPPRNIAPRKARRVARRLSTEEARRARELCDVINASI